MSGIGADYYRARASEMRGLAERAQTEAHRKSFLQLEANWLRLAEQADKTGHHHPDSEQPDQGDAENA